jgi:hypothetical protein
MYSGMAFTQYSGRVMGAHQKFDRVARKHLTKLLPDDSVFPTARNIVYFEGKRGPDGIKIKSPSQDEPWHYYNPFNDEDTQIIELITHHYQQLVKELKTNNQERIAFEAAWLAHAIVDGLTPAHHYPYTEKLTELRGEGIETRTTIKSKLFIPGLNRREKVKNNWQMWGSKGLITTHVSFELGVASIIAPLSFSNSLPTKNHIEQALQVGIAETFKRTAREIAVLDIYTRYYEKGWTPKLAYDVRHKLGPLIIQCLTYAWYGALVAANRATLADMPEKRRLARKKSS